jgi:hypothetical protein
MSVGPLSGTTRCAPLALLIALGACGTILPEGPEVSGLPGSGKSANQFLVDDSDCRSFAINHSHGNPGEQDMVRDPYVQVRYDAAYDQCMIAKGDQVYGTVPSKAKSLREGLDYARPPLPTR